MSHSIDQSEFGAGNRLHHRRWRRGTGRRRHGLRGWGVQITQAFREISGSADGSMAGDVAPCGAGVRHFLVRDGRIETVHKFSHSNPSLVGFFSAGFRTTGITVTGPAAKETAYRYRQRAGLRRFLRHRRIGHLGRSASTVPNEPGHRQSSSRCPPDLSRPPKFAHETL